MLLDVNILIMSLLRDLQKSVKKTFSNQKGAHMCPQMPTYKLSLNKKKKFLHNRSNCN